MYHKTQPSESDYSLHILLILQKKSRKAHITLRESLCLSLCRDPHVLLDADAELDLNLVIVVDLDPLHQPGNDHPCDADMPTEGSTALLPLYRGEVPLTRKIFAFWPESSDSSLQWELTETLRQNIK